MGQVQPKYTASTHPWDYPNDGLPCPLEELERVLPRMHTMTRVEQSAYADAVTRANIRDVQFALDQTTALPARASDDYYAQANACSIGNLALVSLSSASAVARQRSEQFLQGWEAWRRNSATTAS